MCHCKVFGVSTVLCFVTRKMNDKIAPVILPWQMLSWKSGCGKWTNAGSEGWRDEIQPAVSRKNEQDLGTSVCV
jgi:hypothetical protein